MNLSISKESLVKIAFLTSSIAQKKNTMPILANVKMTASDNGTLSIVASDIAVSLRAEVPAKVEEAGSVTVEAKVLYDIV
jgi:DNA polymerase-3 subunit beta